MTRIALGIEYEGNAYHGWQRQEQGLTVQGCLEAALSRVAAEPINVICAGRTDTGVHGLGQVVHFDTNADRVQRAWTFGVNTELPADIRVTWAQHVADDFHARFSATARRYEYVIYNNPLRPSVFRRHVTWHCHGLDVELMQAGANYLIGQHDFAAFRASACQAHSSERCVEHIKLVRDGDFIILDIKANAFLHHMVRNIVGSLFVVGRAEQPPEWIKMVLASKDRKQAGMTAPANGLYLAEVDYDAKWQLQQNIPKLPFAN